MNKIIAILLALTAAFPLSSCGCSKQTVQQEEHKEPDMYQTAVMQFIDILGSQGMDAASELCTEEFKEPFKSHFNDIITESALVFPAFMRDDMTELFTNELLPQLISSISYGDSSTASTEAYTHVTVDVKPNNGDITGISIPEERLREIVTAALASEDIIEILGDYAFIKHMTTSELLSQYSVTTQEQLTNDIYETVKPQAELFVKGVLDKVFRKTDIYVMQSDDVIKISDIN